MNIPKQDWDYVSVNPDPDFDPERNKQVIEETIAKSKLVKERKRREHMDKVRERTDAVAQYITSLNTGKTSSKVVDYFGRRELARLRGEEIVGIIRSKIGDVTKQKIRERAGSAIKS